MMTCADLSSTCWKDIYGHLCIYVTCDMLLHWLDGAET
jgi:hypothetical protein